MPRPKKDEKTDKIIMVSELVRDRLKKYGKGVGVTFNDVVKMLMNFYDEQNK